MLHKLDDLWLTARGIRFYRGHLAHSQYWSRPQMETYQYRCLQRLLAASARDVPYYRRLFREHDFDPARDFRSLQDLERLPVLTKPIARANREQLCARSPGSRPLELRTSGSTGDVFVSSVSRQHWSVEQGIVWRHWSWMGYRFRDKMAIIRSYVPADGAPLWKLDRARNFFYFSAYHLTPANAKTYLEKLAAWRPKFLRGYPSSLYILAQMALQHGIQLSGIRGILTASETLLPKYRRTIESAFGARVFDWYGQAEISVTMNECDAHEGLHINSDYGYCELLPAPELAANERRIVATCLHNYAMPLLRYDTGDVAILCEDGHLPCSHGHTLPRIQAIRGRSDDLLYGPDGRVIPSVNLYTMMDQYSELIGFQFIQTEKTSLEVRINTHSFDAQFERRMRDDLAARFGRDLHVTILDGEDFIQSGEGKKRVIVSRVRENDRVA
ncbi:MAG: phenylacetate--CoA ligase family protein [Myxococcales bacterium FL481]|nr:MAG: phenylacetate--CoA ligase family protein [Myxococcales bacterium FL481]